MRLINADNLLKIFDERLRVYEGEDDTKERYAYMAWLRSWHAIKDAPTIDAVEVVRCKDCRWYEQKQKNLPYNVSKCYCNRSCIVATKENDFCSHGERREE